MAAAAPDPGAARALFVFLDGVGIGLPDRSRNPFLQARLPTLRSILDGDLPTLKSPRREGSDAAALPLDATLETEGLPQSGTGQTSLLTGENAARLFGRHFGPWTPVALRPLLARENILSRAARAGLSVAFANAHPRGFERSRWARRPAAPPLAARAASARARYFEEIARGTAVPGDLHTDRIRDRFPEAGAPPMTPLDAGRALAEIANRHHLTLFAHYGTDFAGHAGSMDVAVEALERVDRFLLGVLEAASSQLLVILASDHGNVEDLSPRHTRNPTLCVVAGARASDVAGRLTAPAGRLDAPAGPGGAHASIEGVAQVVLDAVGAESHEP